MFLFVFCLLLHRHTNVDQFYSGIAVHSTDNKQQASVSDDSGRPGLNSSIIAPMAHEMLKHRCNLQHGPTTFFKKSVDKFVSTILHKAQQMLKQGHRKLCRSIQQRGGRQNCCFAIFFVEPICAKGMQLKMTVFWKKKFCGKTIPCAGNSLFSQMIRIWQATGAELRAHRTRIPTMTLCVGGSERSGVQRRPGALRLPRALSTAQTFNTGVT